jgi:hypothetical protein
MVSAFAPADAVGLKPDPREDEEEWPQKRAQDAKGDERSQSSTAAIFDIGV